MVGGRASLATGTAEREEALALVDAHRGKRRITLGADKAYDVANFVASLRSRSVSPHIAIDGHLSKTGKPRKTFVDRRVTRHVGYDTAQRCRKRIEEVFGWIKASAGLAKIKLRGRARVDAVFTLGLVAYNLVRLPKLLSNGMSMLGDGMSSRHLAGTWPGRVPISSSAKRAASSPSIASLARSTAPAMATTSSSTGTATTRWKKPPAMAAKPKFRLMALSKARSASQMATTYPSSPSARLLQQPARGDLPDGREPLGGGRRQAVNLSVPGCFIVQHGSVRQKGLPRRRTRPVEA